MKLLTTTLLTTTLTSISVSDPTSPVCPLPRAGVALFNTCKGDFQGSPGLPHRGRKWQATSEHLVPWKLLGAWQVLSKSALEQDLDQCLATLQFSKALLKRVSEESKLPPNYFLSSTLFPVIPRPLTELYRSLAIPCRGAVVLDSSTSRVDRREDSDPSVSWFQDNLLEISCEQRSLGWKPCIF